MRGAVGGTGGTAPGAPGGLGRRPGAGPVGRDRARLVRGAAGHAGRRSVGCPVGSCGRRAVRCDPGRGCRCVGPTGGAGWPAAGSWPGLRPAAVRSVTGRGRARGPGPRCLLILRGRRRGKRFLEPPDHRCLYRRGRRSYELAHFLELVHDGLALDTELFREFVNPDLRHYAPSRPSPLDPLPDPGPGRACSGRASAYGHHRRVLIERSSASRPAFRQVFLLGVTACCPARLFRREQCYAEPSAPQRYSASGSRLSDPAVRSARGNARRRRARSRHARLGCRYAPRPGSRACGSGWMTSPAATRRSRLDFSARSLQPTQVRVTGIPEVCRSVRTAIPLTSLPCPHVPDTRRNLRRRVCYVYGGFRGLCGIRGLCGLRGFPGRRYRGV